MNRFTVRFALAFSSILSSTLSRYNYDKNRILLQQTSMQAAVYAAQIGNNEHMINRYTIQNLITSAPPPPPPRKGSPPPGRFHPP